jgi:hypothetical protein
MICPECGKEFEKTPQMAWNRIYCSFSCYRRVNDRRRDFRRDMKPARRQYKTETARRWRLNMKAMGMCSRCGKIRPDEGMKTCSGCREYVNLTRTGQNVRMAEYYKLWKEDNGDN